ncbi:MAG: ATP-binding protein [Spirulinaceae cyanobacterium]
MTADRATTLKTAFQICDVDPLEGDGLDRYYVDLSGIRNTKAINSVNRQLDFQAQEKFDTLLFTGHRGCGKSTELRRIERQWQQEFRVVYLEVNEETDINDVEYTDLYLIVIKQVEFALRQMGLKFDAQLLASFENWFKEVIKEDERTVESSVSVAGEATLGAEAPFIAKLLVKLLAQIRGSDKRKRLIRETLQKDVSRLKSDVNLLLADAFRKVKVQYPKGFLVIFDNLDRVPPNVGEDLFFNYAVQLQDLNCTIIYTVPISVLCSPKNLDNTFGSPHIVPMINIYQLDRTQCHLEHNPAGLDAVASIIEKRVEVEAVFADREQLLALAKASGGHVRQLMQLMRSACLTASAEGHAKIQAEDVVYAINQKRFNFERSIPNEHYPILAQVCLDKNITKDATGQLMLFNTSVLEYNGDNRWNYPNPLVKLSDAFQAALNAANTPGT